MEKFSFYEILSFLIPRFILVTVILLYQQLVFGCHPLISIEGKFGENILLICLSLFAGVLVHVFTFGLLKKNKWVKYIIMPSVQKISMQNKFIKKTIPFLNEEYKTLRKHNDEAVKKDEAEENLFDFAYYYLEVNNKIAPSKNFQSLYFWFRNMFVISLFLIPVSIAIMAITLCNCYTYEQRENAIWILIINLIMLFIIIPTARWLREKYIDKILWSYYVERIHKNENKN
ncbi:MAG: hypothetical protein A2X08_00010 [Bacteroidetes bacterium GWA2_32_17]|nr:MAG: hypothetical protein A2X08_00010 [Bacteroidetes bacterium GWA2_32_17]